MKILLLTLVLSIYAYPENQEFTFNIQDIKRSELVNIPLPQVSVEKGNKRMPDTRALIELSLRIPFREINKRLQSMDISGFTTIDQNRSLISRKGDYIVFENAKIVYNGITVEPFLVLKPYFEEKNKLAIKIKRIEADVSLRYEKGVFPKEINKDEVVAMLVEKITQAVQMAMNRALEKNGVNIKAEDLISFYYEKQKWILHIVINPSFISPLLPGLIDNVYLTYFDFDNDGFILKAGSDAESIKPDPYYNLLISDGLITNFVKKYSTGSFEILPPGHNGGVRFEENGDVEVSGKIVADNLAFKPNVYFTAIMKPLLTSRNVIRIYIKRIKVEQAWGISIPEFINNWLEKRIVSSVVEKITNDPYLKKAISAKKVDDRTIEINLSDVAFLPSFIKGVRVNAMAVKKGILCLSFEF